ncbi:hypothetical protein BOX15_Mlig008669g1 [Macrostomum lignano]|uniref:C2H2-type domain-containing protein n=2 Tax=Macrostomum lignano TaxID=282301 RepID=A0A267E1K6_9PLAT|nr:hypothetical protein BOX15_Mlig008669g1 [Macrostomum lignano]
MSAHSQRGGSSGHNGGNGGRGGGNIGHGGGNIGRGGGNIGRGGGNIGRGGGNIGCGSSGRGSGNNHHHRYRPPRHKQQHQQQQKQQQYGHWGHQHGIDSSAYHSSAYPGPYQRQNHQQQQKQQTGALLPTPPQLMQQQVEPWQNEAQSLPAANPTTSSSASSGRIRPSVHLSSDQTETAGPTTSGMSNSPNRAVRVLDLANSGAKTRKDRRIWEDVVNSGAAAGGKSRTSRSKRPDPRGEDESDTVSQAPMSQPINSLLSASTSQQSQASTSGAGPQGGELAPEAPDQAVDETRSTESKPQPSLAVQRLQQALELSLQEEQLETELESQRQELAELRLRVQEMQQTLENKEAAMKQLTEKKANLTSKRLAILKESVSGPSSGSPQQTAAEPRVAPPTPPPAQPPSLLPPPPAEPCSFDATGPVSASASSPVDEATLQVIRSIIRSEQSRDLTFAEMDRLVAERLSAQAANSSTATGDAPADNNDNDGDDSDDEESTAAPPAAKRPRTSAAEPNDTNNVSSTFACIARSLQQAGVVKSEKSTDITSSSTTNIPTTVSRNGEKENKKQKDKNVKVEADSDDVIVVDLDIRNKLKSNNNNNKSSDSAATIGAAVASVAGTSKSSSRRRFESSSSDSSSSSSSSDSNRRAQTPAAQRRPTLSLSEQRKRTRMEESAPTSTMALPGKFQAHNSDQIICTLISNGFLYTGSADGTAKRFSLQTHECLTTYRRGGSSSSQCRVNCMVVTNLGCSIDVFRIYSGGSDAVLSVHNTRTGDLLKRSSLEAQLWAACHRWDCIYLGLGSGRVCKYDLNSATLMSGWIGCDGPVSCLELTVCEGRRVALVGCQTDKLIIVRDERSGILLFNIKQPTPPVAVRCPLPGSIAFCLSSWCLQTFRSGRWESPISQFSSDTTGCPSSDIRLISLHVSVRSTWLFLGCSDGSVRCHRLPASLASGKSVPTDGCTHVVVWASPGRNAVTSVQYFESARCLVAGDSRGCVTITQLPTLKSNIFRCYWSNCTLAFLSAEDLSSHLKRVHCGDIGGGVKCRWRGCNQAINNENHLRQHCRSSARLALDKL